MASSSAPWDCSEAENWDWPPGRRRKRTSQRATVRATSRPRSSSTMARARSIPAVTPADVQTLPWRVKIGSGSTSTSGWRRARASHADQWVVTRRPSSSPAWASRKAPVQTDATRRASGARGRPAATGRAAGPRRRSHSTRAGSTTPGRLPWPPATISVSIAPTSSSATPPPTRMPLVAGTGGPPRGAPATSHAPPAARPAPWKTSTGPLTSSDWIPGNATTTTWRAGMAAKRATSERCPQGRISHSSCQPASDRFTHMDALVVGAGPTGLLMAAELTRHGLEVRVIDRNEHGATESTALAIHARTVELLDDLGLAGTFVQRGLRAGGVSIWSSSGERLAHVKFDGIGGPFPFVLDLP